MSDLSTLSDMILITLGNNKLVGNSVEILSLEKNQDGLLFYYISLG